MRAVASLFFVAAWLSVAGPAWAQYAQIPRPLPDVAITAFGYTRPGTIDTAAQIGRRLFIGGDFTHVSPPLGGAVAMDASGAVLPGRFPRIDGYVAQILADGYGGWVAVGSFRRVDGQPYAGFVRVTPERTVDPRYRVAADGPIEFVAIAHGRVYLAGDFRTVNRQPRRGLAALVAATGELSSWGSGFDPGGRGINALSVSSLGVYVSGRQNPSMGTSRLWGFDAATGAMLFARALWVNAIAATSARVYVGGNGPERPVWAVDPMTGVDTDWRLGFTFHVLMSTIGDYTAVYSLLVDSGRLYFGGNFAADSGQWDLAAADAATGARANWRPSPTGPMGVRRLLRVGPAVVALSGSAPLAYDVTTAATLPFSPALAGTVSAMAGAPEGVVVGGVFVGTGGAPRAGLASIDLETYAIEPWTSALALQQFERVAELATDGAWLIARTSDGRVAKVDPVTGAVVAERAFYGAPGIAMRQKGGEVVVGAPPDSLSGPQIGIITIADWSYRVLPLSIEPYSILSLDVDGDTVYYAGEVHVAFGSSRPLLAAVDKRTGTALPWRAAPDVAENLTVRAAGGRVWAAGSFRHVGGAARRGLAELDPVTGAALPWNPDVPGVLEANVGDLTVGDLEIGPDGILYASLGAPDYNGGRPTAGGQRAPRVIAYSPTSGRRLPWRHDESGMRAVLPDCLLTTSGCLPRTIASPSDLRVAQVDATIGLTWTLPVTPSRTAVRLEVGSAEGSADLYNLELPASQTSFSATAPPGRYFARVRALAGTSESWPTDDVSFAIGAGVPAAPLDVRSAVDGARVTVQWKPPSTGAPQAYVFEVGTSEGQAGLATIPLPGSATSFIVDAPPGWYWGRLVALNGTIRSAPGNELLVDVAAPAPPPSQCLLTPVAPSSVAATLVGRTVTLTWMPPTSGPTLRTQWVIAATEPGQNDRGTYDVGASASSFSIVAAPGTYFVRVVAHNTCATSATSTEIQVVVP